MATSLAKQGRQGAPNSRTARGYLIVLGLLVFLAAIVGGLISAGSKPEKQAGTSPRPNTRIVSLSPGVTDTIVQLGASEKLVGISDYCSFAKNSKARRTGTAITPNYEVIAELAPDAIVTSDVAGSQLVPLRELAPTYGLPWLTLDEWADSVTRLGSIVGEPERAQAFRERLLRVLDVAPPEGAPRVLLTLDYGDGSANDTWFIRKNSIHGAMLHAAGGRNAVSREVNGPPKLSPERLLEADPDAIIVLASNPKSPTDREALEHFSRWSPLRAVQEGRVSVLRAKGVLNVGPTVLDLVPELEKEIAKTMGADR